MFAFCKTIKLAIAMAKKHQKKEVSKENEPSKLKKILLIPVPLYLTVSIVLGLILLSSFLYGIKKTDRKNLKETEQSLDDGPCSTLIRQSDTGLIRPLLLVESSKEEAAIVPAKVKISDYINQKIQQGVLTTASVYLNDLNTASHFEINPDELYDPASIMKVPMMIIFLKQAREKPELLKQKIFYKERFSKFYSATIKSKTITPGKSYTIEELLYSMIAYSDNEAFWLLVENVDTKEFEKLNEDIEIPLVTDNKQHGTNGANFVATVHSISKFFRILYNASYLGRRMSRLALELLSKSDYKDGLLKGINPSITVAHKFGEREEDNMAQLHEFGIFYIQKRPYLLGVMTKGRDKNKLNQVLADISGIAFDEMNGH